MKVKCRKIYLIEEGEIERMLAEHLAQRRLPDIFLYVGRCGDNWLKLDESAEFAVARKLTDLLSEKAAEISLPLQGHNLLAVGVGSGEKEAILLEAMYRPGLCYVCADINGDYVDRAAGRVSHLDIETICVTGMLEQLGEIRKLCPGPAVITLLGNTFCNYDPAEVLGIVSAAMSGDDLFLFDCALASGDPSKCVRDYNCGLNRNFNIAPLADRGLKQQDIGLELKMIRGRMGEMEVWRTHKEIVVLNDCTVRANGDKIELCRSERIQMGFTIKYEIGQICKLAEMNGFEILQMHPDAACENVLLLTQRRL